MANRPMDTPERSTDRLVRALGVASAGLGVPMLVRTEAVATFAGVENTASGITAVKATGIRELTHAVLLLLGPPGTVWTRVVGDAVDLTLLGQAISARKGERRRRTVIATTAAGSIAAVDLYAALRTLNQQHGRGRPGPLKLQATTTVGKSPDEVYDFWRDFTNLPRFMLHLKSVTPTGGGDRRTRWEANAPLRRSVTWEAELTSEEPGRRIAWKSLPGSTIDNAGTVHFAPAPGDRGTEVKVVLHYGVPGGRLGRAVAKLFGEEPEQQVRDDLRRFKQVMETGDVVRSEGLPQGTDARHQVAQGSNQPHKHDKARKRG